MTIVYLTIGGALGTITRYYLAERVAAWSDSPTLGIFAVNMLGSLLVGIFLGLGEQRFDWSFETRLFVATGFLGGLTTFSALVGQSHGLLDAREYAAAALNLVGSVVAGMAAVSAGVAVSRALS